MIDMNQCVPTHDILFITLDTLRYDVACRALAHGLTPTLASVLPHGQWEERHSPGSFTYAAHQAFFAGFLPTPARPGRHPRLFAVHFEGSETTAPQTLVLDAPDIVSGLFARGYHTLCIGGVGFFNKRNPLGRVLPGLFEESHWDPSLGVTALDSPARQIDRARLSLSRLPASKRVFLFLNISALHQPNCIFTPGALHDTPDTQATALAHVDRELPRLFAAMRARGPCVAIVCSDHGTAYGDDGYHGHRLGHPSVWTVPYAEFILPPDAP